MKDRLVDDIFELIRTMTDEEIADFESFVQKKGRGKRVMEEATKHLQLFRIYVSLRDEADVTLGEIKRRSTFTLNINELNQHLCARMETFLALQYQRGRGAVLKEIELQLDTVTELLRRKRWKHAGELLVKSARVISELPKNQFDERFLYLSLRLYDLQNNWNIKQLLTESKREQLEIFEKAIRPFNTLAYSLPRINGNEIIAQLPSQGLQESCFYGVLSIWLREHEKLESLKKTLPERQMFGGLMNIHRAERNSSNARNKNRAVDQMINGMDTLVRLEKIYLSVVTGNQWEFKEQVDDLLRSDQLFRNPESFNSELTAFVYSQLFRFTVIGQNKSSADFMKRLISLDRIAKVELMQFTHEQIEDVVSRLEMNRLIILFLQRKHKELVATLSAMGFETKSKQFEEYFFDVIGIELLSRLQIGMFDDDTTKLIRKYENNLKPSVGGASAFHGALRKIISRFNETSGTSERTKIVDSHIEQLRASHSKTNHFQKVLIMWLEDYYLNSDPM